MTTLTTEELATITLKSGSHAKREEGVCAMEAVAWLAGEPHSDAPACTSPVIASFLRRWNDILPTDAERNRLLRPLLPLMVDTKVDIHVGAEQALQAKIMGMAGSEEKRDD